MTKLYAQQGYGTAQKVDDALKQKYIDGVIFSPKDASPEQVKNKISELKRIDGNVDLIFDPQYYASYLASKENARLGYLSEQYPYFESKRRSDLEKESVVRDQVTACLDYQKNIEFSFLVAPNILIPRSFNSIEGVVAKHFIRQAGEQKNKHKKRKVYASLVVSREALNKEQSELDAFLDEMTTLDATPDGIYLLVAAQNTEARYDIYNADVIANWMLINHVFSLSGIPVINGYSDLLAPVLGAVGASAGATGWWSNLRTFSLDRFQPSESMARLPNQRYLSCALFNRIVFYELDILRRKFPSVLNGISTDDLYQEDKGSEPKRANEVLQSWEAIKKLCNIFKCVEITQDLAKLKNILEEAGKLYDEIQAPSTGFQFEEKSKGDHLDAIFQGIDLFAKKAEIALK